MLMAPPVASHSSPMASWSTSPAASGSIPRPSVTARRSSATLTSSPYAAKASRPSHKVVGSSRPSAASRNTR